VIPDAFLALDYMLDRFAWLAEGLVVFPERMEQNLWASHGLFFSQKLLLALVESGMSRDDAYRTVQRNAMRTWEELRPFLEVLREDAEVTTALGDDVLAGCFDLDRALVHAGRAVDALDDPAIA